MRYFAEKTFIIKSRETTEQLLNQCTSKVLTGFDLSSANVYVVSKERHFIGQRLNSGEVMISRYRHRFLQLVPRLITKWKIEGSDGQFVLSTKTRLGLYASIALFLMLAPIAVAIIKSILNFEVPELESVLTPIILLIVFVLLTKYELNETQKLIGRVINQEKIQTLVAV